MLKVENAKAFGILEALRGMRNPLNSWAKGDSSCKVDPEDGHVTELTIGPNDVKLCMALTHGGHPHRKFLRQIPVVMDITAPTYWWAEMDTYKISTTRNSCSVQHKGASKEFVPEDFTVDRFLESDNPEPVCPMCRDMYDETFKSVLNVMNRCRELYNSTKNYGYFRLLRQIMPMGYNYKSTWSGNYEVLLNIWEWRHAHKLAEWHDFCREIENLPGMKVFIDAMARKEEE